jgi:hypothetical protein
MGHVVLCQYFTYHVTCTYNKSRTSLIPKPVQKHASRPAPSSSVVSLTHALVFTFRLCDTKTIGDNSKFENRLTSTSTIW